MLALTGLLVPAAEAQTKAEAIDSLLTRYHEHGIFNGVVLVADGHEVVYQKGFGYADMTWGILNAPDTRFLIASITKQFTAALILRLAEQGQIDLQGRVTDYLPEYPRGSGDRIKVHHLLSHTSGIPPFNRLPQFNAELKRNPFVPDSFVTFFSGLELEFEPGSDFAYSNSGYYLLGMIAERVTSTTYAEALGEYILEPLGLDDTGYYTNSDIIERLAEGYNRTGGDYERAAYFDASIPYSSGMLYSTVGDMFKWDQSLYGSGPFERTETATLFLSPQTPMPSEADDPEEVVSSAAGYGLFFEQVRIGADTLNAVFHDGRIDGFRTMLYRVPTRGQTVVVWDNTDGPLTGDIALYLIALLNGQRAPSPEDLQASHEEPEQGSIAVLPFADMSPDRDQEYFSDGFSEELLNVLGQLPELRVAFRTSAFSFKGKDVRIDSIARALNVRHVLEGSVRKAGNQVRITAQLIDASTGDHVWSDTYDRELKDLFQVQDEIAGEIVERLQLELGGGRARAVLAKEETKDPEAHVLLLRGRRLFRQYTREGLEEAEALLKQAVARDPTYARAHAALASVYHNQADQRQGRVEALMGQARAALDRALELDPNLGRAHYVAGRIAYGSGDWRAAEASLARAVELNPGYAPAHAFWAILLAVLDRREEAITAAERAAVLDPLSLARQTDVTAAYIYARQYERAAEASQSALALDPGRPGTLGDLAFVYAFMGRHAEAIRAAKQARDQAPEEQWPLTALAYAYARADRRAEAEAVLLTLEALPEPGPYYRAMVYAGIGETDKAFSLLEEALAERDALVVGLGVDPAFDPYRGDPRMRLLLERLNLPAESR